MFEALAMALKEVAELDADHCTDDELNDALLQLQHQRSMLEAAEARLAAAWDHRKVWAADGSRSAAAWLAHRTRAPKQACRSRLRAGRAQADMPRVAQAWAAGEIDGAHVRRLARARSDRTSEAFARDEDMLLGFARTLPYVQFDQAVRYWSLAADPDGAAGDDIDRRNRRRVQLVPTIGGMRSGSMLLDPISGAIVAAELSRLERQLFDSDRAEAKQRLGREPLAHDLARTPDQRRADALVEMARRSATMPSGGKPPVPLFTALLGAQTLQHLCQLESGEVISPSALRPWLDDAQLERILFDGTPSRVIAVSRQRSFTGALRRLIEARDRTCYHPTCDEPASRCQVDHIQPYAEGGITAQWNGRLACGYHNRQRSQRPPPDGEP